MRARIAPAKYDVQRRNEACWQVLCEAQAVSNAIMLIAVKRHFGLGNKRMSELIETYDEVKQKFEEYENDGILKMKINSEFEEIGVDLGEVWDTHESFEEVAEECRKKNKSIVNVGEARGIREAFDGFKWIMKHKKETE